MYSIVRVDRNTRKRKGSYDIIDMSVERMDDSCDINNMYRINAKGLRTKLFISNANNDDPTELLAYRSTKNSDSFYIERKSIEEYMDPYEYTTYLSNLIDSMYKPKP